MADKHIVPKELKYSKSHEWVRQETDGTVTVGITDHAQALLGDMVFIEAPVIGREVKTGDDIGVLESVKAASDLYSPVAGKIIAVNARLSAEPEVINNDPYGDGWICRLQPSALEEDLRVLLIAENYQKYVQGER